MLKNGTTAWWFEIGWDKSTLHGPTLGYATARYSSVPFMLALGQAIGWPLTAPGQFICMGSVHASYTIRLPLIYKHTLFVSVWVLHTHSNNTCNHNINLFPNSKGNLHDHNNFLSWGVIKCSTYYCHETNDSSLCSCGDNMWWSDKSTERPVTTVEMWYDLVVLCLVYKMRVVCMSVKAWVSPVLYYVSGCQLVLRYPQHQHCHHRVPVSSDNNSS